MEKKIKISGKEYIMKASAWTQFAYKDLTGRSFLTDIKELTKYADKEITLENIEVLDELNKLLLPMTFVMVKEADSTQAVDYKDFLKNIDNLYDDITWIQEVILLACSPISRQLQNS